MPQRSANVPNALISARPAAMEAIMEEQESFPRPMNQNTPQAGPLPSKVGEIGYVQQDPAIPTLRDSPGRHLQSAAVAGLPQPNPVQDGRGRSNASFAADDVDLEAWGGRPRLASESSVELMAQDQPTGHRPSSRRPSGTLVYQSTSKLLLKPLILIIFGITLLVTTTVGFIEAQQRVSDAKASHDSQIDDPSRNNQDTDQGDMGDIGPSSVSFAYIGTIFVVALLVEACLLIGSIRSLYHRLGSFVDQRYPVTVPDPSKPDAIVPPSPALPWWARALRITPEEARAPPLPPYTAVSNFIRTGSIAVPSPRTGDIEDVEVVRTLAMGQGKPAPAFGGEEFRQSTVLLKSK